MLVLSVVGMLPLMRIAERGGRPAKCSCAVSPCWPWRSHAGPGEQRDCALSGAVAVFVGFNYLEATLPSQVSKSVLPGQGHRPGHLFNLPVPGTFAGVPGAGWCSTSGNSAWWACARAGAGVVAADAGAALTTVPVPDPEHAPGTR